MMNMQLLNRSGLAAIAAATALISTPALAQEAAPVAADPAPIVADEPVTIVPLPVPEATPDTLAPTETTAAAPATTRATRTARPARTNSTPAPVARTVAPVAAAPTAPVQEAVPAADPAMVAPVPEAPAVTPVAPASDSVMESDVLPIAGAAGLGILALAGAGFAMRRRRRTDDDLVVQDEWHEPVMARPAPVATAPVVAAAAPIAAAPATASAFNWGSTAAETPASDQSVNRIEAAKRGPTPDNPSLSLKKRLKRAAFFDQRDRAIAAGKAAPVSAMAGLPTSMARPEPQVAAAKPAPRFVDHGMRMSFGKTLQPA